MTIRGKRWTAAAVLMAALAVGIAAWNQGPSGRIESALLRAYEQSQVREDMVDAEKLNKLTAAIMRRYGTNAIPHLLRMIEEQDQPLPQIKKAANTIGNKLGIQNEGFWSWATDENRSQRGFMAAKAFAALGTNAAPAIPRLRELARRDSDAGSCARVILIDLRQEW